MLRLAGWRNPRQPRPLFVFNTAAPAVTTANDDQIWLFGFSATAITPAEQTTLAKFMKAGGGLFATGDHETLGQGMGGHIPRHPSTKRSSSRT